ncbi:hypothetical protein HJD18_15725 [Thermoleophilia bacterium SCSIO 60948]|nr:hypothetical protein HJD18_15725 [Thermoleophilia bacterium SCSIO 60948]
MEAVLPLVAATALVLIAVSLFRRVLPHSARRRARRIDRTGVYATALLGVHLSQETIEAVVGGGFGPHLILNLLVAAAFSIPLALGLGCIAALIAAWLDRIESRIGFALAIRPRAAAPSAPLAPVIVILRGFEVSSHRLARGPPKPSGRA